MKRDSAERYIKEHMDSISVKKIRPLSLRCQCEKCHKEYRRELMYRCNCGIYNNYYGCAQCFPNKNNFLKWLQDNDILYTEESLKNCLKREELDE
ncbi:hypothetical protein [Blautia massiliensis (ex Durand et al. 2017)]|uniref:hypothetical protein n=1 Tax=Blautia massiliensis (ex Durand et al. 2017) TaxID=1737424 RepID=UPI00156E2E35|nr:hypothetical protein [Blautia massiliensis (ex Durand et al. 2017)]NSK77510.1 hypothetical protein [Blautia massiliensis (ex Durand et al. 2017)]